MFTSEQFRSTETGYRCVLMQSSAALTGTRIRRVHSKWLKQEMTARSLHMNVTSMRERGSAAAAYKEEVTAIVLTASVLQMTTVAAPS